MQPGTTRRHGELLGNLVELFLAEGFADFTLTELAKRMHCSKTTLYALGHSKEALVRNVLVQFFRRATEKVEQLTREERRPSERIVVYLGAVADELRPASQQFFDDVAANPDTRAVYERNTRIAGERVSQIIAQGVEVGVFRAVDSAFVADLVANEMSRIQTGVVRGRSGLNDADAYNALAKLVLNGISHRKRALDHV